MLINRYTKETDNQIFRLFRSMWQLWTRQSSKWNAESSNSDSRGVSTDQRTATHGPDPSCWWPSNFTKNTAKNDLTLSNTIKQYQTRCPNGKMFVHQTMFDGVLSPNIYRLSRPKPMKAEIEASSRERGVHKQGHRDTVTSQYPKDLTSSKKMTS